MVNVLASLTFNVQSKPEQPHNLIISQRFLLVKTFLFDFYKISLYTVNISINERLLVKKDLDKLLDGEKIYRHEDLKSTSDKWESATNILQFGTLALLFISMFTFNSMPKGSVKTIIWYWAGVMFILATTAFIVSRISLKRKMKYLNAEHSRVKTLVDDAIERIK